MNLDIAVGNGQNVGTGMDNAWIWTMTLEIVRLWALAWTLDVDIGIGNG